MKHSLKFITLLFFLLLNCFLLHAQKHFLYVQSENQQPFALVMNGKVYSSSDYGYVIVPKLADGKYDFTISFPLNKFPDQNFSCTINKKDEGFKLKNGTDGWALENYKSQQVNGNTNADVAKKNAFGDMLSDVVSDSSLNKKPAAPNAVASTTAAAGSVVATPVFQPQKIGQSAADTGTNFSFVDKNKDVTDTINIFIPVETSTTVNATSVAATSANTSTSITDVAQTNQSADSVKNNQPTDTQTVASNNASKDIDTTSREVSNPFYKADKTTAANATTSAAQSTIAATTNATSTVVNGATRQDCGDTFSDDDLNKLKRKMFSKGDDQSMIQYAVKSLGKKCITTEQVKTLGQLFSSDDGRYNLYDAMYTHTYDYGNYSNLASQIIDPYYKKRFTTLLR